MKRSQSHRYIPSLMVAVAASIPIATAVEMMTHMSPTPTAAPLPSTPNTPPVTQSQPAGSTSSAQASAVTSPSRFAIKGGRGDDGAGDDGAGHPRRPANLYSSRPSTTPTTTTASTTKRASNVSGTFSGAAVTDPFGAVQTTITVAQGKITNVSITAPKDNPVSANINTQAVPYLRTETLTAQSTSINSISGATLTSQAYVQSLQAAMKSAGLA
jgi:uncharacterized protein with FMN-binding domain